MVRQVNRAATRVVAGVLLFLAFGAVLWHLLACESAMSFSPDGKRLAFATTNNMVNEANQSARVYRLMVLDDGTDLRLVEEATENALSAPAFSPDGKRICYVRMPAEMPQGTESSDSERHAELYTDNRTLPDALFVLALRRGPVVDAMLVIRDAEQFTVLNQIGIRLLAPSEPPQECWAERPQYSPNGDWVYFCAGAQLIRVDPVSARQETLAAPALCAQLSPDGKTVAFLTPSSSGDPALGILKTDGEVAVYRRLDGSRTPLLGLTWKDNQTVAVLDVKGGPALQLFGTDGSRSGTVHSGAPLDSGNDGLGELALSPDGRSMVISCWDTVLFMDAGGGVRSRWKQADKDESLLQPAFAPDSKQVAFKLAVGRVGEMNTKAIVFFSVDGKEISRVRIPAPKWPEASVSK